MANCYEFYCLCRKDLENVACVRSKKSECQIKTYLDIMKMKYDVKFNMLPDDRAKFEIAQKEFPQSQTYRQNSANAEHFKNPKFHDKNKYKTTQIKIDSELSEFVKGYFNFTIYNSYQEYLSELLERTLKQLLLTRTNPQETLT